LVGAFGALPGGGLGEVHIELSNPYVEAQECITVCFQLIELFTRGSTIMLAIDQQLMVQVLVSDHQLNVRSTMKL
jgi:hypothetical protein